MLGMGSSSSSSATTGATDTLGAIEEAKALSVDAVGRSIRAEPGTAVKGPADGVRGVASSAGGGAFWATSWS